MPTYGQYDLRRGVPLMSPSLLSKRLKGHGQAVEYHVTAAGEELRPIIEQMGTWGQRWARGDVKARHMDASLLMWDIHRNVHVDKLPAPRVVVHFHLRGYSDKKSRFWLMLETDNVDMCLADPGYDIDVFVEGHVRTMVDYWMGRVEFADAVRSGDLRVEGPRPLVRALPTWFKRSGLARGPPPRSCHTPALLMRAEGDIWAPSARIESRRSLT